MNRNAILSLGAFVTAGLYAIQGTLNLSHDQPEVFETAFDYWVEGFFVAALLGSVMVLALAQRLQTALLSARIGLAAATIGNGALAVAAIATTIQGKDSLDPLFILGFLAIVAGYLTLLVTDLRGRLVPSRAGVVLFAGFFGTVVVDNLAAGAGGLVLAASWAALARLLSSPGNDEVSREHGSRSMHQPRPPRP